MYCWITMINFNAINQTMCLQTRGAYKVYRHSDNNGELHYVTVFRHTTGRYFVTQWHSHKPCVNRNIYLKKMLTACSLYAWCRDDLPESTFKYQLLGLNLLCLLSQNRLAEFHTVSGPSFLCLQNTYSLTDSFGAPLFIVNCICIFTGAL